MRCARYSFISRPLQSKGAGNAGRPKRPIATCATGSGRMHTCCQVTPESPGIPHAMVYGLFRDLPGARALWPPSPALLSANLTPASRCQDHTASPSASNAFVKSTIGVHRIPPRVVDVAQRPFGGAGQESYRIFRIFGKAEYFCERGLTNKLDKDVGTPVICPSGNRL